MKTIYLDIEYRCHLQDDGTMEAVETDVFDGKCDAYVEGYRFIPEGRTWAHGGEVYCGRMIAPWRPYSELDAAQRAYEREQLADMRAALELLGVSVDA